MLSESYPNNFMGGKDHAFTYTVKCSFHDGLRVFLTTSVFLGGCPSTLNSKYGSGFELKMPPKLISLALVTTKGN